MVLIGCLIMVLATVIEVGAVYMNDATGLYLFLAGYIFMQLGLTMVGVIWAALVSDFGELYPARKGVISALFYLFFNAGAILGVLCASTVLPVTPVCHGFWWFLLVVNALWLLAVALVPRTTYNQKPSTLTPPDESDSAEAAALRASFGLPAAVGLRSGVDSMRSRQSGSLRRTWPICSSAEGYGLSPRDSGVPKSPACALALAEASDANLVPALTPHANDHGPVLSMLCA